MEKLNINIVQLRNLLHQQERIVIENVCDFLSNHNKNKEIDLADIRNIKNQYPKDIEVLQKYLTT